MPVYHFRFGMPYFGIGTQLLIINATIILFTYGSPWLANIYRYLNKAYGIDHYVGEIYNATRMDKFIQLFHEVMDVQLYYED